MGIVDLNTLGVRTVRKTIMVSQKGPTGTVNEVPVQKIIESQEAQPILTEEEAASLTKDYKPVWKPCNGPCKYVTLVQGRRFFTDVLPEVEKKPSKLKGGRGKNN